VDPAALYGLAHHLYWEMKSVDEGLFRSRVDEMKYQQLVLEVEKSARVSAEELIEIEADIDRQIRRGFLPEAMRDESIRRQVAELEHHRSFSGKNWARTQCETWVRVPPDHELIDELLNARHPEKIKELCKDVFTIEKHKFETGEEFEIIRPNWTISDTSRLPGCLTQFASEFIEALKDDRFPKSGRPSSRKKQLWFLSRTLAGAVYGIATRTAINLLGSVRPDENNDVAKLSKRPRRPSKPIESKKS
jgi:hypothetical protein